MSSENAVFTTMGASNHSKKERVPYDYYATDPKAMELLLEKETFHVNVLEPCCGGGHLSEVLTKHGFQVKSTDLIDRGYGEVKDFFSYTKWSGDVITNPPYKLALEFVEHALKIIDTGNKVAMFLKLTFLETKKRRVFFEKHPPKYVYVCSGRIDCWGNGDESVTSKAIAYAWYVWEKGFKGEPRIRWIN